MINMDLQMDAEKKTLLKTTLLGVAPQRARLLDTPTYQQLRTSFENRLWSKELQRQHYRLRPTWRNEMALWRPIFLNGQFTPAIRTNRGTTRV